MANIHQISIDARLSTGQRPRSASSVGAAAAFCAHAGSGGRLQPDYDVPFMYQPTYPYSWKKELPSRLLDKTYRHGITNSFPDFADSTNKLVAL